jgi:uncharacterized protein YjbI with pentapeptide repeats
MVNYNDTTLTNTTFTGNQSSIPFINTVLTNCIFNECNLDYCQFLSSSFSSCQFINCSFTETNFNSSTFENITISNCSFLDTNLSSVTFTDFTFFNGNEDYSNCLFNDTNLSGLTLDQKIMENCDFTRTNMSHCIFSNINFNFSTFHNTTLTNIQLSYINFNSTVFYELDFSDLDLSDNITLLKNSNDFISFNEHTILPSIELDSGTYSYEIRQSTVAGASGETTLSYLIGPFINLDEKNLNGIRFTDLNLTDTILTTNSLQNCSSGNISFDTIEPSFKDGYKLVNGYIIGPYVNIVHADLSGADLSSVDFYWTKTDNNTVNNSTIFPDNYNIYGVETNNVTTGVIVGPNVVLIQADITDFHLSTADLSGVRSGSTIGDETTLLPSGYKLEGGYILGPGVNLQQVTLTGLDLTNVDFTNCIFQNTKCSGGVTSDNTTLLPNGYRIEEGYMLGPSMNISDTDFQSKTIDFSSVDLTGVRTKNIINYQNITWPIGYTIINDILFGPHLSLVNSITITNQTFSSINFTKSDLTMAEFTNCTFENCLFDETIFYGTNLTASQFISCSFQNILTYNNVNFTSTTFSGDDNIFINGTTFSECLFVNITDFSLYTLSNKHFISVDFTDSVLNTDLSNSILTKCNFSGSDLSNSTLSNVVGTEWTTNENTILPTNYIISGQQLISTTYTETDTEIIFESTSTLTNETTETYMTTMFDIVSTNEQTLNTILNQNKITKPIFISTTTLNKTTEIKNRSQTQVINSNTTNSNVSITNLNTTDGYYITLYNIGEEVIINLLTNHTLKIRKKNDSSYEIFKNEETEPSQTENVGYQGEFFGFIYTLGSISGYYIGSSNICFPAGEFVLTNEGYVDFKDLDKEKHIIRGKKIEQISQTTTREKNLVQIEQHAFGFNIPNKTTLVSQNHKILYNKRWLTAKQLTKFPMVSFVEYTGQTLYNVELNNYYSMTVNNMNVETLKPVKVLR